MTRARSTRGGALVASLEGMGSLSSRGHPSLQDAGIKQHTAFLQAQLATTLRGRVRYLPSALLQL